MQNGSGRRERERRIMDKVNKFSSLVMNNYGCFMRTTEDTMTFKIDDLLVRLQEVKPGQFVFLSPRIGNNFYVAQKFNEPVETVSYDIDKIGPDELFKKFQLFVELSLEHEFPDEFQQIRDNAEQNLNHNRHNSRGHN